jgi:hypothetical protein
LYAPPFLMRLIVELYDKVLGEYHAYGNSTSSRLRSMSAVLYVRLMYVPGTVLESDECLPQAEREGEKAISPFFYQHFPEGDHQNEF